ncbi:MULTISPECIES: hypothetical protein [unclassified Janthinobacterium]|uniref:hypothetical protein n=1 Tax=unclassified Janthinobacterium TaxID=2610881 RepID=UPI000349C9C0|nr:MULTISPECIES: hypothetical protein [unclassified Janthinobacterium]MEC5159798.1 hypothetical protein [Janthinobacterium sp. CG_S6]
MEKLDNSKQTDDLGNAGAFSLTDTLVALWRGRRAIAAGTVLVTAAGAAASLYLAQYKSEGFLQFGGAIPMQKEKNPREKESPGIPLADYKRFAAAFGAVDRFDQFVRQNKLEGNAGVAGLRLAFASNDGTAKMIEAVYPFTKLDAKDLMEQPKDSSNNVIGLRISYAAGSAENAQRTVGLLGRYVVDSIVYLIYSDNLRFKHSEITSRVTKLDNDIIDNKERLEEYRRRGESLRQIVGRHPDSAGQAARQVVSVTEENARFLSPVTHLMSTEVEASNASEAIVRARREQRQSLLRRDYYDRAKQVLEASKSGESVLRALDAVKESVFKDKDLKDELVKEVYNEISIDNQNAISLFLEKTRFIAGPSLPENRSTRLSSALMSSFLFGLLFSSLLVLGRNWWRANGQKIGA